MAAPAECLISIVAPLENEGGSAIEAFVSEAIEQLRSIAAHYEIILVDDGTHDDTRERVTALLARHDFVRLLRLSRHFGEETAIAVIDRVRLGFREGIQWGTREAGSTALVNIQARS